MVARDTGPDANGEDGDDGAGSPTKEKITGKNSIVCIVHVIFGNYCKKINGKNYCTGR
jgi:hypothetical protein